MHMNNKKERVWPRHMQKSWTWLLLQARRAFVMPIRYTNVTSRDVFIKNVAALLHLWHYRIENYLVPDCSWSKSITYVLRRKEFQVLLVFCPGYYITARTTTLEIPFLDVYKRPILILSWMLILQNWTFRKPITCSWHQKNETMNSQIHEFKVLQKGQRAWCIIS